MNSLFICTLLFFSTIQTNTGSYIRFTGLRNFNPPIYTAYNYISINNYRFNPREKLPDIPAELKAASDYYLVQFQGPVYEDMKKQVESYGVKIIQYVPYNTFIVRMNASIKIVVERLSFVTWIGNYEPAYKISPLFKQMPDEKRMLVILFYDENIETTIQTIKNMGAEILDVSVNEYNKIIKIQTGHENLAGIAQLSAVMYIEPWLEAVRLNKDAQWVTQTWRFEDRRIWRKGLYGRGQVVNTADTGILTSHDMFRDPAISITTWGHYPTHRKIIAYRLPTGSAANFGDNASGGWHGTHTAGTICGNDEPVGGTNLNDGMPPLAKIYFMDIGMTAGGLSVPTDLTNLYNQPYTGNTGGAARISSQSWGTTTGNNYTSYCVQTDNFMWYNKDFLIFYASGGGGPGAGTVQAPATSKDIVTVGATENGMRAILLADFSARGPTADNRYKPTVTAPGYFLYSSVGANNNSYVAMSGTSFSTPCAAGSAVLIREYFARGFYPTGDSNVANAWNYISAALVKACLINGASPQINSTTIPDNNTGWGRVLLEDVLCFYGDIRKLAVVDDTTGVATGEYQEYVISVNNQSEPLKIALVWTDYPAVAGANPAIVNNLDLELIAPDGTRYRGNQYTEGQSIPNPTVWDTVNVEECGRVNVPVLGDWTIRVYGTNVPQGPKQPFALAVSGGLGLQTDPVLHICGYAIRDYAPGNQNNSLDPGETVYFTDTLKNLSGLAVSNCQGRLRTSSPFITLIDTIGNFGNIQVGYKNYNGGSRFRFTVSPIISPKSYVSFILHLSGAFGYNQDISFDLPVGINYFKIIWGPKTVQIAPGDSQFLYGITYNPTNSRIYVANFYSRHIYMYTRDSNVTYLGSIPAPDTACTDLKYCSYDNTFWVAANPTQTTGKKIVKIDPSGTILREFSNPANDYPTGLAWMETRRTLYLADRRTAIDSLPQFIYHSDTLGSAVQMSLSFNGHYGPRCMAIEPISPYYGSLDTNLLLTYTWFNNTGTNLDSVALYELRRNDLTIVHSMLFPGWNARGIEYDPWDYNYWVTIPQNPERSIAKIGGFYEMLAGIDDNASMHSRLTFSLASPYPNPFTRRVTISYVLLEAMQVCLYIYDVTGRLVATLADDVDNLGVKTVMWDGRTANGARAAAGVYFCRLETNRGSLVRKIVLTR